MIVCSSIIISDLKGPESLILGSWDEVSWEYERVNSTENSNLPLDNLVKKEICSNMFIHEAETWVFKKNNRLQLVKRGHEEEELIYNLRGRGNILEMIHKDNGTEIYQIQDLTKNKLVLHFNFDLQVKGIVKMTFSKVD